VFCSDCLLHGVRLPSKFGVLEPARVCDICQGLLDRRQYAFSIIGSKGRKRPLNLAAENEDDMKRWVQAFTAAVSGSGDGADGKDHAGGKGAPIHLEGDYHWQLVHAHSFHLT